MSKVIDITDKLSFDTNPIIKVKDVELEINSDATTMLKIMGSFNNKTEMEASLEAADLLFGAEGMKKIETMKLQMKDLMVIIQKAMEIAMESDEEGEAETHTTT